MMYWYENAEQGGIRLQEEELRNDDKAKESEDIYPLCFADGYDFFRAYKLKETIKIGSGIDDDIYIRDSRLAIAAFTIDSQAHRLYCRNDHPSGTVNEQIAKDCAYCSGTIIRILNLQVILLDEAILVNACENIYVNLTETVMPYALPEGKETSGTYLPQLLNIRDTYAIHLEEPLSATRQNHTPVLFSMGPAITMSAASLCTGMLTAYNGWLMGRNLVELLPVLTLPGVMLVSTLLWQPLHRIYENSKERKLLLERSREYRTYLQDVEHDIGIFLQQWNDIGNNAFLHAGNLDVQKLKRRFDDHLFLRLGTGKKQFMMELSTSFRMNRNDEISRMVKELVSRNEYRENVPLLLDLAECKTLIVNEETFFLYLLLQIVAYTNANEISLFLLAKEKWLEEHRYLKHLNASI